MRHPGDTGIPGGGLLRARGDMDGVLGLVQGQVIGVVQGLRAQSASAVVPCQAQHGGMIAEFVVVIGIRGGQQVFRPREDRLVPQPDEGQRLCRDRVADPAMPRPGQERIRR